MKFNKYNKIKLFCYVEVVRFFVILFESKCDLFVKSVVLVVLNEF